MSIDIHKSVSEFCLAMEARLVESEHKTGWHQETLPTLLDQLLGEIRDVFDCIERTDDLSVVQNEILDVANFCMKAHEQIEQVKRYTKLADEAWLLDDFVKAGIYSRKANKIIGQGTRSNTSTDPG